MILYPFLASLAWILQTFPDKELLNIISIPSLMLLKILIPLVIFSLITLLFNQKLFSQFIQDIQKIKKTKSFNKLLFVSIILVCSMYIHYLGYTKFKISKFISLETLFSILLSLFIGYWFFNEKLEMNEYIGILFTIISIIAFYYKELKLLIKK